MALSRALVLSMLLSEVSLAAASTPKDSMFADPFAFCQTASRKAGCTCDEVGLMDNTSHVNCSSGTTADYTNCNTCCGNKSPMTCMGAMRANNSMCGMMINNVRPAKTPDGSKVGSTAGTTAAQIITNCCKDTPKTTCSAITCTNRRRSNADTMIKKVGVAGTVECTGSNDCDDKCCQQNAYTCGGNLGQESVKFTLFGKTDHPDKQMALLTTCGVNHTSKKLYADETAPECKDLYNAAGKATYTNNATFLTTCCDAKADYSTCSSVTCGTAMQKKANMPTGKCAGVACTAADCCELKTGAGACLTKCEAGTDGAERKYTGPAGCEPSDFQQTGTISMSYCNSTAGICDAATQVIDKSKMVESIASATNAQLKTACCVTRPVAPKVVVAVATGPAKCAAFFTAAKAEKSKADSGSALVSAAQIQGASLTLLAAAVLLSTKMAF